ncbi:poly(ethylene terephthalate) hydrolase family protein [Paenibacillus ihumii]|uniref:poly(ethylene terephthalate) hydrolase family protein n=1 Tax=Paenibacillus ihumii TaxID=687436 RepID=UPI0006D86198|nr:MFS transporter [Paenibacillus ihumii]
MELQPLQTEYIPLKPKLTERLGRRIRQTYRYDSAFWRIALAGPWGAAMFVFALAALGMPTGLGALADIIVFISLGTVGLFITAHMAAVLLAVLGLPLPRLYAGVVMYALTVIFFIFWQDHDAVISAAASGILTLAGIAAGIVISLLYSRIGRRLRFYAAAALGLLCVLTALWIADSPVARSDMAAKHAEPIPAENPAKPGSYGYTRFDYGSGKDYWRKEFGRETDLITPPVDASAYIKKWPAFRTRYWGFDQSALPLNGRVWMPEGNGPFPLVLMVHGNHLMEDFSDEGYGYLGELLASRGFIAVSVDENYLNYSVWTGIPDNDMKVRAWILLKHLQQIDKFAEDQATPFYQKVNFDQIGLIGHSRGGQAVAMTKDAGRWFSEDETLSNLERYNIQAVIAISPTDKKVDGGLARIRDVSYLAIQGARDADVIDFDGDRQYIRTSFTKPSPHFKASIYIADANHSQFNTEWGFRDISYPKGIFLSQSEIMGPKEQREIAKIYVSAFLESTLHGEQSYRALFQDYRSGLHWLPAGTEYFNRFESANFYKLAWYDDDLNRVTLPDGGLARGEKLTWVEEEVKNRKAVSKGTRGVTLEWAAREDGAPASYSLTWNASFLPGAMTKTPEVLSFSLADRSFELSDPTASTAELEVEVELLSTNDESARILLSDHAEITRPPDIAFTIHPWVEKRLSNGKYKHPQEAVFQTVLLPLSEFKKMNERLDLSSLKEITFYLSGGPGKIMLDDIGIYE